MTTDYPPQAGARFYVAPNYLMLSDQLNLSRCALERSIDTFEDRNRSGSEYVSALAWKDKRVKV